MAHSAATGSAKRTVNVIGKRLGIKRFGGEFVKAGEIIVRQRGSEFYPGKNAKQGRDFTIFATAAGFVKFRKMTGYKRNQKFIDILETINAVVQGKSVLPTEIDTVEAAPIMEVKKAKPIAKKTSVKAKAKATE